MRALELGMIKKANIINKHIAVITIAKHLSSFKSQ